MVVVRGTLESRYGQVTLRLASATDLAATGETSVRSPSVAQLGDAFEPLEGRLLHVTGTVAGSASALSDGFAVDLTGSGATLRVVAANATGIASSALPSGAHVTLSGVLGQRDSSGTGTSGYRLNLRDSTDIGSTDPIPTTSPVASGTPAPSVPPTTSPSAPPSPTPSASPSPRPTPTLTPTPTPMPSPSPSPSPSHTPGPSASPSPSPRPTATPRPTVTPRPSVSPSPVPLLPISGARAMPLGTRVSVEGTVTVEVGRLLRSGVTFVQDGTGGIAVSLPSGTDATSLPRGRIVQLTGTLAAPYANLELRVATTTDVVLIGSGGVPQPQNLTSDGLVEAVEGTLAQISGDILRVEAGSTGSIAVTIADAHGQARVFLHASLAIPRSRFATGQHLVATGIVGQRESAAGLGDGYRIWPRDGDDLTISTPPRPTPTPSITPRPSPAPTQHGRPSPRPKPSRPPGSETVRIASVRSGDSVTVEGVVTAPGGLLDGDDRRVTIQDDSAAILLRFPDAGSLPRVGTRLRAAGDVGTYYGGLQLEAAESPVILGQARALPVVLRRAPAAGDEWQLVRLTVRIVDVSKSGDTWRAEASLGAGGALPIAGLADSGIPSSALVEGRGATITGIVKRAYPTASDQRFAVVPRTPDDIQLGPEPATGNGDGGGSGAPGGGQPGATGEPGFASPPLDGEATPDPITGRLPGQADPGIPLEVQLSAIPGLEGRVVRVAGSLRSADGPLLTLEDGVVTATARLVDANADFEPPLVSGEVLNVTGLVAPRDVGGWEVVTRRDEVLRAAALVIPTPLDAPSPSASPQPSDAVAESSAQGPGDDAGGAFMALVAATLAALASLALAGLVLHVRQRRTGRPGNARSSVGPGRIPPSTHSRLVGAPAAAPVTPPATPTTAPTPAAAAATAAPAPTAAAATTAPAPAAAAATSAMAGAPTAAPPTPPTPAQAASPRPVRPATPGAQGGPPGGPLDARPS